MHYVEVFCLNNQNGMSVEIINFGARVKSILFPISSKATEMIIGYSDPNDYLNDPFYLGATCGRVANRIENSQFIIEGQQYSINANEGDNCLHGGKDNFSNQFWSKVRACDNSVTLSLKSPDGDQGFPGCLFVAVTYTLTENNELKIEYTGKSNKATPINLTNHTYFSLGNKTCESLELQIHSQKMLERKSNGLPSGKIVNIERTDFDFKTLKNIGKSQLNATDKMLKDMGCYDHCFVLDDMINEPKASLVSHENKVTMNVYTDQLAIQLYTGVALFEPFVPYQGVCLEAQNYSNAINIPHFPERVLTPEITYRKQITFEFLATSEA